VPLLHTYLSATPPCLEYEYVAGGELTAVIQDLHGRGQMTPTAASRLLLRLAEIVGYAHRLSPPIVHRDLKPANVLVQQIPDGEFVLRVADFGIGGIAADRALQQSSRETPRGQALTALRGACTPLYASPEQRRGLPPDPRDDVHALGVIWYQLLTGDLNAEAPRGLQWYKELREAGMSEGLLNLLASCVESRAANRPADALCVAEALAKELRVELLPASRPAPVPAPPRGVPTPVSRQSGGRDSPFASPPAPADAAPRVAGGDANSHTGQLREALFLDRMKRLLRRHAEAATPVSIGLVVCGALVVGGLVGGGIGAWIASGAGGGYGELFTLGFLLGVVAFIYLFWWIGKVRRRGRELLLRERIQAIAHEHPQEVGRWGGVDVLRDARSVREVVHLLERKTGGGGPP
jgi:serine/threonine protein kinase